MEKRPKKKPRIRKSYRQIVVDGVRWQWLVGRGSTVAYNLQTGEKAVIYIGDLVGLRPDVLEKMRWKHSIGIVPQNIVDWIRFRAKNGPDAPFTGVQYYHLNHDPLYYYYAS